jgi:hypothetical protein
LAVQPLWNSQATLEKDCQTATDSWSNAVLLKKVLVAAAVVVVAATTAEARQQGGFSPQKGLSYQCESSGGSRVCTCVGRLDCKRLKNSGNCKKGTWSCPTSGGCQCRWKSIKLKKIGR